MENDGAGIEEEQPVGPLSDDDLMTSFQHGNLNAFVELLERHQNDVFAIARNACLNHLHRHDYRTELGI